jgi:PhnB protein
MMWVQLLLALLQPGAELLSAPRDYDYHYRQASIRDPFGHHWLIEKKI